MGLPPTMFLYSVDEFGHGFFGFVGLHRREAEAGTLAASGDEARADAIRPVFVFAQDSC